MRRIESVSDFQGDIEKLVEFERMAGDQMLQSDAIEKFHDNKGFAILLANVINCANVRVIEGRCGMRFALEASKGLRIIGYVVRKKFQRDAAMKAGILGSADHAHAAATEPLDNTIVGDGSADERGGFCHWLCILGCENEPSQRIGGLLEFTGPDHLVAVGPDEKGRKLK